MTKKKIATGVLGFLVLGLPIIIAFMATVALVPHRELAESVLSIFVSIFIIVGAVMGIFVYVIFGKRPNRSGTLVGF